MSPDFLLYFSTAFSFPSVNFFSSLLSVILAPSTIFGVIGVSESIVLISFAPMASPIFKQSLGMLKSPESTRSGNIAGSSKFSDEIIVPASVLQHTTATSFFNSAACSALIDIKKASFLISALPLAIFLLMDNQLF